MDAETEAVASFIHTSEVPMTVADPSRPDCPIISSNAEFQSLTGYSHAMINGKNCRLLQGSETDEVERARLSKSIKSLTPCVASLLNFKSSGEAFNNLLIVEPIQLQNRQFLLIGCQFGFDLDISRNALSAIAADRYSQISRVKQLSKSRLPSNLRDAIQLRASASVVSVRNYLIKRQAIPYGDPRWLL